MSFIKNIFNDVEKILYGAVATALNEGLNTKAPSKTVVPGDVELIDILLLSEDQSRTYSLMSQVVSLEVFESVTSPVMFAELHIADSIGLLQSFPIIGEEYVKISFKTPKNKGQPATYLFRVNQVKNKTVNDSNKRLSYTLQLCSSELIKNSNVLLTKKQTENISNIIRSIMEDDIDTQKPVNIDTTIGIEEILLTRLQPFKAIDMLRQRAVSGEFKSSSFCFFENRKGFNFTTIERMMDVGGKQIESGNHDKVFFFDTSRKDSIENVTMRNILAYNQLTFTDTISKVASGGLNNQIQQFDLITGDLKKVTYTDNIGADQFKKTTSTAVGQNTTNFTKNHGRTTSVTKVVPIRTDKPPVQVTEKLSILQAYAQKITQNIVLIHIYGDSDINAGDMIECRFPTGIDSEKDKGVSRLDSGSYLVSKVRHIILNGDRPQYTMALELIKGDLQEVV
jgi:hypothetical protein